MEKLILVYQITKKNNAFIIKTGFFWSGKRDLNPRPLPWQGNALPTELFPQIEYT